MAAYKSVVKEKEALEASFSALNSASEVSPDHATTTETNKESAEPSETQEDREDAQTLEDPLGVNKKVILCSVSYMFAERQTILL